MPIHLPPLTRRRFLQGALLGSAALGLRSRLPGAAPAADPDFWALLSDSHLDADRTRQARGITMAAQFSTVIEDVLAQSHRPAGALVNGDLAYNSGETGDYALFVELVAPLRAAGVPLHLALGNHDHRERFWAAVGEDPSARRPVADRQAAIVPGGHANWFVLDSLDKTNSTPGVLGEAQLGWLASALDRHADRPAVIVTHHNPSFDPARKTIVDQEAFYAVVRPRRHVKAHVFGHSHRWNVTQDPSGLHLINLPATAYPFEPTQAIGWVKARLARDGVQLELRCLDRSRRDHGQRVALAWRT